jgi:hypothetical protein
LLFEYPPSQFCSGNKVKVQNIEVADSAYFKLINPFNEFRDVSSELFIEHDRNVFLIYTTKGNKIDKFQVFKVIASTDTNITFMYYRDVFNRTGVQSYFNCEHKMTLQIFRGIFDITYKSFSDQEKQLFRGTIDFIEPNQSNFTMERAVIDYLLEK